ncbi:MAG: hypothetical protein ACJ768_21725 [Gaiellaceae bacterium]
MAFAEVRERDLDAEIAAIDRKRADEIHVVGHSLFGRIYAIERLHDLVPIGLAMRIAWAIGWLRWYWPPARRRAIGRISLTVAGTSRAGEERALARKELAVHAMRFELDARSMAFRRARVEGLDRLERARVSGRPLLLTGAHIGGGWARAIAERGFAYTTPVGAWLDPDADVEWRGRMGYRARGYRRWALGIGVRYVPMGGSYEVLRALLERGETCMVMCDPPGSMRTRMAGKAARMASGPATLAHETGALVVPVLGLLHFDGPHVEVLEPIDPLTLGGPQEILDRLAEIYGDLMVRHPEQVEPAGFTKGVFAEDSAGYPSDLWWFPALRTRARNKTRNALRRLEERLDGVR